MSAAPPRPRAGRAADAAPRAIRHVFAPSLQPRRLHGRRTRRARRALLVYGLWRLGISPARLVAGLGQLGTFLGADAAARSRLRPRILYPAGAGRDAGDRLPRHAAGGAASPFRSASWRRATRRPTASSISPSRRVLDTIRGVDTLIWALIWVNVVGLGPFAGVLAIDDLRHRHLRQAVLRGDRERPTAAGRGRDRRGRRRACTRVRFGVLPQVLPVMAGPGAVLLRVQHPLLDHHRHRRRRRHRPASGRADPHAGMAARSPSSSC